MHPRSAAVLFFLALFPAAAYGSSPSFNLDRLRLNPGGDTLLLGTGDGLQRGQLRLSLGGQYQHDPLVYAEGDETVGAVVGYRLSAHLAAAYGITDWFEAGLELPVVLTQGGDPLLGVNPLQATVIGAPQIQGRFTFLRESRGAALDLGMTLGLSLPLGSEEGLTRDPGSGLAFNPRVGLGKRLGSALRLGLEAGMLIREEMALSPFSVEPKDQVGNELDLGVVASTLGDGLRGELALLSHLPLSDAPASAELMAGARYPFRPLGIEGFAMAGPGIGGTPGTPAFRVLAGLAYAPAAARSAPACEVDQSCPHLDMDRDGVPNHADACPDEPGLPELDGCPDAADAAAADDDVPNLENRCPQEAGSAANEGCTPLDSDGDGIPNDEDLCPNEAGLVERDGCPEPTAAVAATLEQPVEFSTGEDLLSAASRERLSKLASALRAHPALRIRIEGHTDSTGNREVNLSLSRSRAEAVKAYLVEHGVEAERLEPIGLGPDQPIADNDTSAGRAQNRRAELRVMRQAP